MGKPQQETLFGHPVGLYTLFFAEMWERFSYYGMRALLVFYMIKGFLGFNDNDAYAIYGAYTALVYMTPFFGGILADRLLGARRAVILGGVLMAAGQLLMTVANSVAFYTALALIICGNGFFKPNISTIVGSLYSPGSPKRDGGFTIFYMGINLGAAMSPLLCGYIGETFGWQYGFGLATIGMLAGIAVFVAPSIISQTGMYLLAIAAALNVFVVHRLFPAGSPIVPYFKIGLLVLVGLVGLYSLFELGRARLAESFTSKLLAWLVIFSGATAALVCLVKYRPDNPYLIAVNILVGIALMISALVCCLAIYFGGIPEDAGRAPDEAALRRGAMLSPEWITYLGTILAVALFVLLVSGFAPFTKDGRGITLISEQTINRIQGQDSAIREVLAVVLRETSRPAGLVLMLSGLGAALYLIIETFRLDKVPRERMFVVLILTFFSMLFWSFFEQAGSSVNNFTDRNVDRAVVSRLVTQEDVGKTIRLQPTQRQLGYYNGDALFTINVLDDLREANKENTDFEIEWKVEQSNVGMGVSSRNREIPASTFQSVNPIFIMVFGLLFTAMWGFLSNRRLEPSTPVKFAMGLFQLGLGFGCFWYGAFTADERGMVQLGWLLLGYLFQTTGELCLSPVGLSMVTKLSPTRLVSTVMGAWFLATAFSLFLAAIIAQFTGVEQGGNGAENVIPIPSETVHVYGGVFGKIAIAAMISSVICFALAPLLKYWMHEHEPTN